MSIGMSTANFITLSRLPLLLGVAGLIYLPWPWARYTALALLPILFLMDWFDGYVARQKNQVTDLGSVLDIALDRVVENVLWIVFADLGFAPAWVPILFITRSFVVDGLRGYALARGRSAFGMMHSPWGRFLVAGRFMRGLYGLVKVLAFCSLALAAAVAAGPGAGPPWLGWVGAGLVYLSAALCLARGIPVLLDIRAFLDSAAQEGK